MAKQDYSGTQPPGHYSLWGRLAAFFILWLIISLGFLNYRQDSGVEEISYTVFKSKVEQGQVSEILVKGQEVTGEYRGKARETRVKHKRKRLRRKATVCQGLKRLCPLMKMLSSSSFLTSKELRSQPSRIKKAG